MTNNPLIDKWEEIYGKKEEPKEEPKKVVYEIPVEFRNPCSEIKLPTTLTFKRFGGDNEFLKVADKIQKGEAKVVNMITNMENFSKSITFEVHVYT
jgi:hypothetical protein